MKTDIHPKYSEMTVKCSCGNTFTTNSTKGGDFQVELCNECHPFFTGKQKLIDSAGRVERFQKRFTKTQDMADKAAAGKSASVGKAASGKAAVGRAAAAKAGASAGKSAS